MQKLETEAALEFEKDIPDQKSGQYGNPCPAVGETKASSRICESVDTRAGGVRGPMILEL